jgi:hypothetical protein
MVHNISLGLQAGFSRFLRANPQGETLVALIVTALLPCVSP